MRTYRATIRQSMESNDSRNVAYEYACTCGAVGGRSTLLSQVRGARRAHLRNAHSQ